MSHRGYPKGGLLRFHLALVFAVILMAVPLSLEVGSLTAQVYLAGAFVSVLYALVGYLVFIPFSALGGTVKLSPKDESIVYSRSNFGQNTAKDRPVPWPDKLETEIAQLGLKIPLLPLSFYRVNIVTEFMTYHVATFGPRLESTAQDFCKSMKQAHRSRG